ncbi:MAG: hypothetical protein NVV73_00080 [Cellvibrionaceae bacterium]|nr:hypothetical protein [Cellvibrionaceae bacterium]
MTDLRQPLEDMMTGDQWPILLDLQQRENRVDLSLKVDEKLRWLQGHFPSQPVLAGVVQTHWAAQLAHYFFSTNSFSSEKSPRRIDNLKFQNVVIPPRRIALELVANVDAGSIHFRYSDPDVPGHIFSEGKLVF